MYIPAAFQVADEARLYAFIQRYSFASVITQQAGTLLASHVPLQLETPIGSPARLSGHLARANPQWRQLGAGAEVLVIFAGPHAYVSPSWYETQPAVPTWNYTVVHAYGVAELITERAELLASLQALVQRHESRLTRPWNGVMDEEFRDRLLAAIVGFRVTITRLEGKFKLSQNRSTADVAGVIQALLESPDPDWQAVAEWMRVAQDGAEASS